MTDKEILHYAVLKAETNGYKFPDISFYPIINTDFEYPKLIYSEDFNAGTWTLHINAIIFSHEFAKAFWGEKKLNTLDWYPWPYPTIEEWRYQLGYLAMTNQPLKYLEKFL